MKGQKKNKDPCAGCVWRIWTGDERGLCFFPDCRQKTGMQESCIKIDPACKALRAELEQIRQEVGAQTIEQVVYAWVMMLPSQPLPLIGSGKRERIAAAVAAESIVLNRQQWFRIRKAALGYDVP